ncbi:MAG: hypothetical protein ACRDOO_21635 [Actinomadura sp.]
MLLQRRVRHDVAGLAELGPKEAKPLRVAITSRLPGTCWLP